MEIADGIQRAAQKNKPGPWSRVLMGQKGNCWDSIAENNKLCLHPEGLG